MLSSQSAATALSIRALGRRLSVPLATSVCSLALLAVAPAAHAQTETPADAPDAATDASGFSDAGIIVMARRKAEALEDVPQTVTVATGELLGKLQIEELGDLDKVVAGVQIQGANISMRGLTFSLTASSSPTVATYFNDVPVQSANLFTTMFDVGQIEVLRGPQGTLRGISSPSGALTLTSRRPDLSELGGFIKGTINDIDGGNLETALNLPIIPDMLAIRLAGVFDRAVNPVRSLNNPRKPSQETLGRRLSVRFEPTSSLAFNFIYNLVEIDGIHYGEAVFGNGSPGMPGNPFAGPDTTARSCAPSIARRCSRSIIRSMTATR